MRSAVVPVYGRRRRRESGRRDHPAPWSLATKRAGAAGGVSADGGSAGWLRHR